MDPSDIKIGRTYRIHIAEIPEIAFDFTVSKLDGRIGTPVGCVSNATSRAAQDGWVNGFATDLIRPSEFIEEIEQSDGLWIEEVEPPCDCATRGVYDECCGEKS